MTLADRAASARTQIPFPYSDYSQYSEFTHQVPSAVWNVSSDCSDTIDDQRHWPPRTPELRPFVPRGLCRSIQLDATRTDNALPVEVKVRGPGIRIVEAWDGSERRPAAPLDASIGP